MSLIDSGSMLVVEFASALVLLALMEPWSVVVRPLRSRASGS